jgi:hypothetical protein
MLGRAMRFICGRMPRPIVEGPRIMDEPRPIDGAPRPMDGRRLVKPEDDRPRLPSPPPMLSPPNCARASRAAASNTSATKAKAATTARHARPIDRTFAQQSVDQESVDQEVFSICEAENDARMGSLSPATAH